MTYFIKRGNSFFPTPEENVDIRNILPVGTYTIDINDQGQYFLSIIDNFEVRGKQYGNNNRHAERILNTFNQRKQSTGVMLVGEKGSGKSLLAKTVSIQAQQFDIPTIVVNSPFFGDKFNQFIQGIDQPCIIIFDEFEKVYDSEDQEKILTLLDGTYPSKKLFILTCNNKFRVDYNMKNRPGRIYYMIEFAGLEEQFIREYCQDNLNDKTWINQVCAISNMFGSFNFDMLQALVAEMNMYGDPPEEVVKLLNVKPELDEGRASFAVTVNDTDGTSFNLRGDNEFVGNPLSDSNHISFTRVKPDSDEERTVYLDIEPKHLIRVDAVRGVYEYKVRDFTVKYSRSQKNAVDIWASAF